MDFDKVYSAENKDKGAYIRLYSGLERDLVLFWREHFNDCVDSHARDRVRAIVKNFKGEGTLSLNQIRELKDLAKSSNFIG